MTNRSRIALALALAGLGAISFIACTTLPAVPTASTGAGGSQDGSGGSGGTQPPPTGAGGTQLPPAGAGGAAGSPGMGGHAGSGIGGNTAGTGGSMDGGTDRGGARDGAMMGRDSGANTGGAAGHAATVISFATSPAATVTSLGPTNSVSAVAMSDVNGDGRSDLLILEDPFPMNNGVWTAPLFLNNGMGAAGHFFNAQPDILIKGSVVATGMDVSVALGDVDGDGKPDLAVLIAPLGANTVNVTIFLNVGGATFFNGSGQPAATLSFPGNVAAGGNADTSAIALGDVDGDGRVDLALLTASSAAANGAMNTMVFLNNGSGAAGRFFSTTAAATFSYAQTGVPSGVLLPSISLGDIDGDGKVDLALMNAPSGGASSSLTVALFLNSGSGPTGKFFATSPALIFPFENPQVNSRLSMGLGDIDGDKKADLAIVSTPLSAATSTTLLLLNTSH